MPDSRLLASITPSKTTMIDVSPSARSSPSMAERIVDFDWRNSPLGPISEWPDSLRTAVGICMASPIPSFVWWGKDLINFYNDAYAPLLGGRHPSGLGVPAKKLWTHVWTAVADDVYNTLNRGTSVVRERVRFNLKRHGLPDEMYLTYTFSPIPYGHGGVGGIFQIAIDETRRVLAERQQQQLQFHAERGWRNAQDAERRLANWQAVIANMSEGVVLADASGNLLDWNNAALAMLGYSRVEDVRLTLAEMAGQLEVFDTDGQRVPFEQWPLARLLRGETIRNLHTRVRRRNFDAELSLINNGTLIRDADGNDRLALLTLQDATLPQRGAPPSQQWPASSIPRLIPPDEQYVHESQADDDDTHEPNTAQSDLDETHTAENAALRTESLLESLVLSQDVRDFCKSLGQRLVEDAMNQYLLTAHQGKGFDGSCIAVSLTIALIIVNDL